MVILWVNDMAQFLQSCLSALLYKFIFDAFNASSYYDFIVL